jgi:hypothetical protein
VLAWSLERDVSVPSADDDGADATSTRSACLNILFCALCCTCGRVRECVWVVAAHRAASMRKHGAKGRRSLMANSPPSPLGPNAPRPAMRAVHLLLVAALVGFSVYDWRVRFPSGQTALQHELDALQGGAWYLNPGLRLGLACVGCGGGAGDP